MVVNYLPFCLSGNDYLSFTGEEYLCWTLFLNGSFFLSVLLWKCHPIPSWPVWFPLRSLLPDELEILYMLFVSFLLLPLRSSLSFTFESLIIIYLGAVLFGSNLFCVLWPSSTWIVMFFSQVLESFMLFLWLNFLPFPLARLSL